MNKSLYDSFKLLSEFNLSGRFLTGERGAMKLGGEGILNAKITLCLKDINKNKIYGI